MFIVLQNNIIGKIVQLQQFCFGKYWLRKHIMKTDIQSFKLACRIFIGIDNDIGKNDWETYHLPNLMKI